MTHTSRLHISTNIFQNFEVFVLLKVQKLQNFEKCSYICSIESMGSTLVHFSMTVIQKRMTEIKYSYFDCYLHLRFFESREDCAFYFVNFILSGQYLPTDNFDLF